MLTFNVIGLDPSLTSTGVASTAGWVDRIHPKKPLTGINRLRVIVTSVRELTKTADLAVLEGPSYNSTGGHQHERAGLWWMVYDCLDLRGIPTAVVAPASRCRYATGKGNASKDAVLSAVVRRFPDVEVTGNDEADALVLAAMGADYLGRPMAAMPATHRAALDKVAWPDLDIMTKEMV